MGTLIAYTFAHWFGYAVLFGGAAWAIINAIYGE